MATAFVFEPHDHDRTDSELSHLRVVPTPSRRSRHLVPTRLVALLLAVAGVLVVMTAVQADQPVETVAHVVQAGDTLWVIAEGVTPADGDVRATVHEIREINELSTSALVPGQELLLPAG